MIPSLLPTQTTEGSDIAQLFGLLASVAPLTFYGLLWWMLNTHLWKWKPLNRILGVPDLNGIWHGKSISSYRDSNGNPIEHDMQLVVKQRFDAIQCNMFCKNSFGESQTVGIRMCNPDNDSCYLDYSYVSNAGDAYLKEENWAKSHRGFSVIYCHAGTMEGDYFTDREPSQTKGHFVLKRD